MAVGSILSRRRSLPRLVVFIIIVAAIKLLLFSSVWKSSPRLLFLHSKKHRFPTASNTANNVHYKEGKVNIDIWTKMCTLNLNSLRQFPLFPLFPSERKYLTIRRSLQYNIKGEWTSVRIMGYLHPPKTGQYVFYLRSPFLTQLWLSTTAYPNNATKIAYTSFNIVKKIAFGLGDVKAHSEKVFMRKDEKYYFEMLQALNDPLGQQVGTLVLYWMLPESGYFDKITGSHVSEFFNVSSFYKTPDFNATDNILPSLQLSEQEDITVGKVFTLDKERLAESKKPVFTLKQAYIKEILGNHLDFNGSEHNRTNVTSLPFLGKFETEITDAFESCTYNPEYTKRRFIKRYEGVWSTFFPSVFPNDGSNISRLTMPPRHGYKDFINGNDILKEKDVINLVKIFMDTVNRGFPRKYTLNSITTIERFESQHIAGEKYLIELALRRQANNKLYRFSKYFLKHQKLNQTSLCYYQNLQWDPRVWINVILNVKDQAGWILSFVQEMARILRQSRDEYVNFVIADYGNKGIDIAKEMERHGLKNFNVFKKAGAFYKTSSINMAASKVKDPNSIIFLMDLHLQFPSNIFETVRKHTIQGKAGFSPMLMRLVDCGRPKTKHVYSQGYYEPNGFGIFATYKSDWDKFGGMNEREFKNKWGGEDWEMVDRVLMNGYEIEKLRLPGFYHYFHDKVGMWN